MTPPPVSASPPRTLPAQSHYNSGYIQIENFVFNPTLVTGFLLRPATSDESVPVTEVFYGAHHISVEDKNQNLFHYLCYHTAPIKAPTTI